MSFRTLNIGATALLTQKYGLDITGQNIANASTPGYSRQRVNLEANRAQTYSFGAVGTGVQINTIKRIADEFLEKQVRLANSTKEFLEEMQNGYENLQVYFNELTDNDLSSSINDFFAAIGDFSNNVEDISTRRTVVENANSMITTFNEIDEKLRDYRERENDAVVDTVNTVNRILSEVAELNQDILRIESGGTTGVVANDLRDQRTERLKELSGLMDITVTESSNGSVNVSQKNRLLVFENQHFDLKTVKEKSGDILIDKVVFAKDEEEVVINDGELHAQIELRDTVLKSFRDDMDELAAGFIWEVNRVHSQNVGLEGFSNLAGTTSVVDPTQTLNNLTYDFTPISGTFEIENGNFEIIVHDKASDRDTTLNIEIDLDGNAADPDTILYDATNPTAANSLVNKMQTALDTVQPGLFTVSMDLGNHINIVSNNNDITFSFGRDTSGAVAALGLNTFFDGWDAGSMKINDVLSNNVDFLAGAKGEFTPGDNTGALELLKLRDMEVLDNGTTTLEDFYEGVIGRMAVEANRIDKLLETQVDILTRMENQREDLSGVNLDEELTKMIQFQRSYQSAARFISTADAILESLINM